MTASKCCFCVDLRVGCMVVAALSLINPVSMIINDLTGPLYVFPFLLHVFLAAVSILLIAGIAQGRKRYFHLYLILQGISIGVLVLYVILALIVIIGGQREEGSKEGVYVDNTILELGLGWSSVSMFVYVYFFYVVFSYYKTLDCEAPARSTPENY